MRHLEFLVEELSMEAFLREFLPRFVAERATYAVHPHRGKQDLLSKLMGRLRAYKKWLPEQARIIVLVDRDDDDCAQLKNQMEDIARKAGLTTRRSCGTQAWTVANRIAVEELEAWFFGEWAAVRAAYPRASPSIPKRAIYREPDKIAGGTWEALERVLFTAGHFQGGLRKVELAMAVGKHFDAARSTSPSFITFRDALTEALA